MTEKCEHCPVIGPECRGLEVRRLCELALTRPDYRRKLQSDAGELPPLQLPTEAQKDRLNTCLYRECQSGCLMSVCWASRAGMKRLGQPGTEVSSYDCIACLQNNGAKA